MSVALMYHGIFRGDDTRMIDSEDLPYAVSEAAFTAQLDAIVDMTAGNAASPSVIITFDDGHASNHDIALPLLLERKLTAWFFVTTDFIGQRDGFCSVPQVRALADAGMTVGSHGCSHAFFDDLDRSTARDELILSRRRLLDMGIARVDSLSFPGGRWTRDTLVMARNAGYDTLFCSRIGTIDDVLLAPSVANPTDPLARVAVKRDTSMGDFGRIIRADSRWFRRRRITQGVKQMARGVLGNRIYHGLYKSLS